jgi:sarcosine oxidase
VARDDPPTDVDVLVIGGGVVGAAAALALAPRGGRLALVERAPLGVATGSSKGGARIYAPAAYPREAYLELGLRGLQRWRRLEVEAGERLLSPTGALSVGEFAGRQLPALGAAGIDAELVSQAEAQRRFGVRTSGDHPLVYQPDAGVIHTDRAMRTLMRQAERGGVALHGGESVSSIEDLGDRVEVETERRRWRCSAAIVAAGPWSGALLAGAGIALPLTVSCQTVAYFGLANRSARPVAVIEFDGDEPFAAWDPRRGLKAGLHKRGPVVDPSDTKLKADPEAIKHLSAWVDERFPGVTDGIAAVEPCLYTNVPEEEFILERRGRIVVAAACNGHGFQFALETGARVAELALEPATLAVR